MSEELTENIRKNNNEEREDINEAPKKKPKLDSLIEDEAADSDSENEGGDDNESDIESEKDEYEKDGFVVSDDEASDSDDEGNSKRKTNNLQRLKKRTANVLDIEDQELIRDAQLQAKAEEATDDMDEEIVPERFHTDEIAPVVTKKFNQYDEYDSDDGMRDFIVDDVGEEAGEGGVEGIGGEAPRKSGDFFGQHGSVTASSRRRDGPQGASREQLEDAMAIFGDGFDEFDFDDEEEPLEEDEDLYAEPGSASEKKKIDRVKASFEHAALVESFCTSSDDVIRNTDIPERLQEWLNARKLSKKDFIGTSEDDETLSARLLSEEAKWVTRKLVEKLFYKNKKSSSAFECVDKRYNGLSKLDLTEQLNEPVLNALRYMQVDHLEVPFIATYRKDYLHPLLNSQNLWNVLTLDEKYAEFTRQKLRLTLELDVFNEVKEAWQSRNDGGVASSKLDDVERELANAEDAYNSALNEQKCSNLLLDRYMDLADTDDATDIDRENVVLEEQKIAEIAKRLGELELVLQKCRERSEIAAGRKQLSDSLDEMAVVRTLELMPVDKYRSIVDSCDEELFLSDIRNYMQMLFLGSEGAKKTTVAIEVVEEVSPPVTDGSDLRISKKPQKPITTSSLFDDDDEDDDSSDYEGEEKTSDEHTESNPDQEGKEKELAVETSVAPKKVTKHVALKKQLRRATSKDTYFKIRQLHGLREFAQLFTPSPSDFSQTLRYGAGMKTECNTPLEDVETLANEYMVKSNQSNMDCSSGLTSMFQFKSADEYVRGVQKLLAIELSHEPCVRLRMRDIYRSYATLSTEPTEKGDTVITPFHELFGYSFLKEKPISDLFELQSDATTYVRLMKAQADGLIRVTINAPDDKSCFLNPLISAYLPTMKPELDINPEIRTGWDAIRMNILKMCVEKFLIPSFEEETRRELARLGRDGIIEECTATFSEMIRQGPYRYVRDETTVIPPNQERGAPPRAMKEYPITQILLDAPERRSKFNALSLWVPQGRGAMGAAFLDEDGVVRAQSILPEDATRNALPLFIKGLLDKFRPKVVVLNSSGGRATLSLQNQLNKHLISEVSRESLEAIRRRRLAREDQGDYAFYEEYDEMPYTAQVLISEDTIARIFKESKRSTRMFKEFDPSVCAAICLGRSVQEPLAEYCMMWTNADSLGTFGFEAMYLDLHPMKVSGRYNCAPCVIWFGFVCNV